MNKIVFSIEDCKQIVDMYKCGISIEKIGKVYNCSRKPIQRILHENDIELCNPLIKIPKKDYEKIIQMYNDGMTQEEIAIKYECSKQVICGLMKRMNIPARPNGFTLEQATEMYNMWKSGKTFDDIALIYNTDRHTVGRVLKRNGYKIDPRKFHCDEYFFDNINTSDKAYILGLLWADGCNSVDIGKITLQLQEKDRELLDKISEVTKSDRPLTFTNLHNKNENWSNTYTLIWRSRHMSNILESYGMVQRKSLVLEFPQNLDEKLFSHFIRGYLDGDGSISIGKNNQLQVSMIGANEFIFSLKNICDTLNVKTYISKRKNGNEKISTLGITNNYDRVKFLQWIYNDANLKMDRKYQKYQQFLEINNINNSLVG